MIKNKICLSILLLSTLTMSIPVHAQAQEQAQEQEQVQTQEQVQEQEQAQEQEQVQVQEQEQAPEATQMAQPIDPQSEQQVDVQEEQLTPQISLIQYSNVSSTNTVLSISSSGTAYASAYIAGYPSTTTQVIGYLNLEHMIGSSWVTERSWCETTATAYLYMSKSCDVSVHGTYRLRLVGYVYSGSSYEQITTYSSQFTY